jgi:hypothetical protein
MLISSAQITHSRASLEKCLAFNFIILKTIALMPGLITTFSVNLCNVLMVGKKKVVLRKRYAIGDKKKSCKANCLYSFQYLN